MAGACDHIYGICRRCNMARALLRDELTKSQERVVELEEEVGLLRRNNDESHHKL